jgi:hypothetical protein
MLLQYFNVIAVVQSINGGVATLVACTISCGKAVLSVFQSINGGIASSLEGLFDRIGT